MEVERQALAHLRQDRSQRRTERLDHLDVHRQAVEERARATVGLVDGLIGQHQIARRNLLAQAADGGAGQDVRHPQALQRVDVGPERNRGRVEEVAVPVSRQQRDRHPADLGRDDGTRGHAERRVEGVALARAQGAERFSEAGASDDPDHGTSYVPRRVPAYAADRKPRPSPRFPALGGLPPRLPGPRRIGAGSVMNSAG